MDLNELNSELASLSEPQLLSLPAMQQWLQQNVSEIELDALPVEFKEYDFTTLRLKIIRRDDQQWGVRDRLGRVLHRDGRWFDWPMPSEDVPDTRFSLPEAIAAARQELPKLRHMGMDSAETAAWIRKRVQELDIEN